MFEINPTDHKSIRTSHFPDEGFSQAVPELIESEQNDDLERLWVEQTPLKYKPSLVPGSRKYKGLLCKGLGLSGKKYNIVICGMFHVP